MGASKEISISNDLFLKSLRFSNAPFTNEGLMGGEDEIAEYENGGVPWCITYTFMPDELKDILERHGVKNIELAVPQPAPPSNTVFIPSKWESNSFSI